MDVTALRLLTLITIAILCFAGSQKSGSRFTNLKCETYDLEFAKFNKCRLKVLGRGVVGLNVYINMLKLPVNNIQINWSFWRRYSGYKPFLYNISYDFCRLLDHPDYFTFQGLVFNAIRPSSNLNHSCPIDTDVIVDNLVFKDEYLRNLPLPQGEYKVKLRFAAKNIWKLQVEVFILRDE